MSYPFRFLGNLFTIRFLLQLFFLTDFKFKNHIFQEKGRNRTKQKVFGIYLQKEKNSLKSYHTFFYKNKQPKTISAPFATDKKSLLLFTIGCTINFFQVTILLFFASLVFTLSLNIFQQNSFLFCPHYRYFKHFYDYITFLFKTVYIFILEMFFVIIMVRQT